jgi:hypothetical protein
MLSNIIFSDINNLQNINNNFIENNKAICSVESKKADTKTIKKNVQKQLNVLTYENYIATKPELNIFKIPELKSVAKKYKLYVSGTKGVLIERIKNHFNEITNAIKIQKNFRGSIVRRSFKLRGPAFKNKSICVNETDGFTLEPLNEVPFERFFSYSDSKNFTYGFDVVSLVSLFKRDNKIANPYTRERLSSELTNNILSLGRIIKIVFSYVLEPDEMQSQRIPPQINIPRRSVLQHIGNNQNNLNTVIQNLIIPNNYTNEIENNFSNDQLALIAKIRELRTFSIERRIQNVFIEIDFLGNYTQSSWFSSLERRDFIRFLRCLYEIWNYRAQMPAEIKRQICQFRDPFYQTRFPNAIETDINEIKNICITVMEDMVYTGIDNEFRKLGTLHVLSALTTVSVPARNSMNWLYESLYY